MAKDVDLSSKEWTDLVFEGKNKEFGAYTLRRQSENRHFRAVAIVLTILAVLVTIVILSYKGVFTFEDEVEDHKQEQAAADIGDAEPEEEPDVNEAEMPEPEPEEIPDVQEEEDVTATQQLTDLNIVTEVEKDKEIKDMSEIKEDTRVAGTMEHEGVEDLQKDAVKKEVVEEAPKVEKPKEEGPISMAMVEQKPAFPGGDAAMYKWLGENINYPAQAQEEGVSGKVTVQFVVEKDGSISHVAVARGKHPALDAEAVRVVKKMPKWTPGRNNGQPVRVTYMLPVTFKLQ